MEKCEGQATARRWPRGDKWERRLRCRSSSECRISLSAPVPVSKLDGAYPQSVAMGWSSARKPQAANRRWGLRKIRQRPRPGWVPGGCRFSRRLVLVHHEKETIRGYFSSSDLGIPIDGQHLPRRLAVAHPLVARLGRRWTRGQPAKRTAERDGATDRGWSLQEGRDGLDLRMVGEEELAGYLFLVSPRLAPFRGLAPIVAVSSRGSERARRVLVGWTRSGQAQLGAHSARGKRKTSHP